MLYCLVYIAYFHRLLVHHITPGAMYQPGVSDGGQPQVCCVCGVLLIVSAPLHAHHMLIPSHVSTGVGWRVCEMWHDHHAAGRTGALHTLPSGSRQFHHTLLYLRQGTVLWVGRLCVSWGFDQHQPQVAPPIM